MTEQSADALRFFSEIISPGLFRVDTAVVEQDPEAIRIHPSSGFGLEKHETIIVRGFRSDLYGMGWEVGQEFDAIMRYPPSSVLKWEGIFKSKVFSLFGFNHPHSPAYVYAERRIVFHADTAGLRTALDAVVRSYLWMRMAMNLFCFARDQKP